jgi:hypothetical protein
MGVALSVEVRKELMRDGGARFFARTTSIDCIDLQEVHYKLLVSIYNIWTAASRTVDSIVVLAAGIGQKTLEENLKRQYTRIEAALILLYYSQPRLKQNHRFTSPDSYRTQATTAATAPQLNQKP